MQSGENQPTPAETVSSARPAVTELQRQIQGTAADQDKAVPSKEIGILQAGEGCEL